MAYDVDVLIQNLQSAVNNFFDYSANYTHEARLLVAGTAQSIPSKFVPYITPPKSTRIDRDLSSWLDDSSAADAIKKLSGELVSYFSKFFPDIDVAYTNWINQLARAVNTGVPLTLPNHILNAQRQALDAPNGIRANRKIRMMWAERGYSLPPGMMVGDILDEADMRTEKLVDSAISAANQATEEILAGYKAVISTALAAEDARIAAVRAMTTLIFTAASVYNNEAEYKKAVAAAQVAAVEATLAYYSTETRLDALNTELYKHNVDFNVKRFAQNTDLFFKNEAKQVDAAIAAALHAAKVAQAAYASLNSIVSASTVGFG